MTSSAFIAQSVQPHLVKPSDGLEGYAAVLVRYVPLGQPSGILFGKAIVISVSRL